MTPEQEQELSHVLLVELLAYQFASPVRWIETQDVILAQHQAERIVEIGPSDTLGGMAKRTLAAKYETYDAALSLQRQILCYMKDEQEIYYRAEPSLDADVANSLLGIDGGEAPASQPRTQTLDEKPRHEPTSSPNQSRKSGADRPLSAMDVLHPLIAHKLKKDLKSVNPESTIKELVGGKSTMQNEIIGDLEKEFDGVPEKSEDIPLVELGSILESGFPRKLGKQSNTLVGKMISTKMPGGFSLTDTRGYLQEKWGFAVGEQDGCLVFSLLSEPAARISSEAAAKEFWDASAKRFADYAGISLASSDQGANASSTVQTIAIDSKIFDSYSKAQNILLRRQMGLLAEYLGMENSDIKLELERSLLAEKSYSTQLDVWVHEHGEEYGAGIVSKFSPLKVRVFDSSWNWARQDALSMYYDIIFGRLRLVDREIVSQCLRIMNRSSTSLLSFMRFYIDNCPVDKGDSYHLARNLGLQLIDNCKTVLNENPVYKDVGYPTGPKTVIDELGKVQFLETWRDGIRKLEDYVSRIRTGVKAKKSPVTILPSRAGKKIARRGALKPKDSGVSGEMSWPVSGYADNMTSKPPHLHIRRKRRNQWELSIRHTNLYLDALQGAARDGLSFHSLNVLITGAGKDSIGAEILQGLISGGATVVATTSRFTKEVVDYYQTLYSKFGARGARLFLVPFNQGSKRDVDSLIDHVYDSKSGLGLDLDVVVPFAAISSIGSEIDAIDSKSELAHRIMLTNVIRLIGKVKSNKESRGVTTRPAQVILPLSPNHGTFGNDGLYSESKLGLETLFNRWSSEGWSSYLTICGAVIGWTRGTGLMAGNNIVSEGLEAYGIRTFSQQEMAFNILGLLAPVMANLCQVEPVYADLSGGLQLLPNLQEIASRLRKDLNETAEIRSAVSREQKLDEVSINGEVSPNRIGGEKVEKRANIRFDFPTLPNSKDLNDLAGNLRGMVDLERTVVITGFGEVGPWGSSRTRWEMEAYGEFSLEGCIEMAWIMGLIKNFNGTLNGKFYSGWVDSETGQAIQDKEIKLRYEKQILDHSGIRLIEPDLFDGYNPERKQLLQEVVLERDLEPFEASKETGEEFKRLHAEKVDVSRVNDAGQCTIQLKKGATLLVPKAIRFDRLVAGQIPTGWNAERYGITKDIIDQVDPVTLYVLVSVAETLICSGITDPYEFYEYVHFSEVGNCIGSGVGGMTALRGMYKDRLFDKPVQKDILQESFINTMSAWVNMLLLSSSGPIKTPVGACATAVESLDIGFETIVEGKARICIVGGFDDFAEEGSYEFANMKATSNTVEEFKHGRTPRDMSRPTTTTRSGFMEAQGCGTQILMSARTALDMGVPIYGIVALTATASDKIGRSVPAPGQGIVTTSREVRSRFPSPLLDISYRKRQLDERKLQIKDWGRREMEIVQNDLHASLTTDPDSATYAQLSSHLDHINREVKRQMQDACYMWGNAFFKDDPRISPIRGALATWGLTVDDLHVASFHGTSTKANDKNESESINKMLSHLGRTPGNPVMGIFQKYLTGHPKGAAGAWMLNGCLQVLSSGLIPGNRNADNVDSDLQKYDFILYPNKSIQTDGVKAFTITSFGFGQKGAQAICVHPQYLYAALEEEDFESYKSKVQKRQKKAYRYFHTALVHNNLFQAKSEAPYKPAKETEVLQNPLARVEPDSLDASSYSVQRNPGLDVEFAKIAGLTAHIKDAETFKVGVDVEEISGFPFENEVFIKRNFTDREILLCSNSASTKSSFVGKWCAKEAVFKSLGVASEGGGSHLKDIEILSNVDGAPLAKLSEPLIEKIARKGWEEVKVSITHSETYAMAFAISTFSRKDEADK